MKSPVLKDKHELDQWLNENHAFGICEPNAFPCIVILDYHGTVMEIVTYSEFQRWRYQIIDENDTKPAIPAEELSKVFEDNDL